MKHACWCTPCWCWLIIELQKPKFQMLISVFYRQETSTANVSFMSLSRKLIIILSTCIRLFGKITLILITWPMRFAFGSPPPCLWCITFHLLVNRTFCHSSSGKLHETITVLPVLAFVEEHMIWYLSVLLYCYMLSPRNRADIYGCLGPPVWFQVE